MQPLGSLLTPPSMLPLWLWRRSSSPLWDLFIITTSINNTSTYMSNITATITSIVDMTIIMRSLAENYSAWYENFDHWWLYAIEMARLYDFQCSSSKITRSAMEWSSGQNPDLKEEKNLISELQRMTLNIVSLMSLCSMVLRPIYMNWGECSRPIL